MAGQFLSAVAFLVLLLRTRASGSPRTAQSLSWRIEQDPRL